MTNKYQHAGTRLGKIIDKNLKKWKEDINDSDTPAPNTSSFASSGDSQIKGFDDDEIDLSVSKPTNRRLDCRYRNACDFPSDSCKGCLSISRGLK